MTRIAFTLIGGKSWTGGYNYLINLLKVVTTYRPGALTPVLFFGTDMDSGEVEPFRAIDGIQLVFSAHLNADRRSRNLLKSLVLGVDPTVRGMFRQHGIEVVFENAQFHGWRLGMPAIAWIPDFQHRELPHLFSRSAWFKRELGFRAQIAAGRSIMLSSEDARESCERHYPSTIGRTQVVRFAVSPSHRPSESTVHEVRQTYGLPNRYFFLPNQFWQHKNHLLVVEALAMLKRAGQDVVVVASGRQFDPYKPTHFSNVAARIDALGVQDQFRLLGLIPYEHVVALMAGSVAVLNPSLFEGWSTTVEEARALRLPLVLSDLKVHQEQAIGWATFFDRTDARSLADALLSVWQAQIAPSFPGSEPLAFQVDPVQRFADDFVALVKRVATRHAHPSKDTQ